MVVVYDRWRHWRNDGRPFDAFFGHSQDSPAGGSAYTTEVLLDVLILYNYTSPRGYSKRALWGLDSGFTWFISWHSHLLRYIRIQQEAYD